MTIDDLIYMQLQDLKEESRESRKELSARMDRLDVQFRESRKELNDRMDRLENRQDKLDARIDKLDEKIDKLASKIDSSMNQGQICLITTIGIAVAVFYSLFFK